MISFKQLEALYWIAHLGSFEAAARKLHTSQSAVSKRVQELESTFDNLLFDRSRRTASLTPKGQEMLALAKDLLDRRTVFVERFSQPEIVVRRVRLGITEMTAMTWLPRLVEMIQSHYPRLILEPVVDNSNALRDGLALDRLDVVVLPDAFGEARFTSLPLRTIENVWACKPGLLPARTRFKLSQLSSLPLVSQDPASGSALIINRWLRENKAPTPNVIIANNLLSLIAMTMSGFGVSYLPKSFATTLVGQGRLQVLAAEQRMPRVPYAVMYRSDDESPVVDTIARFAQRCCDFSEMFQSAAP